MLTNGPSDAEKDAEMEAEMEGAGVRAGSMRGVPGGVRSAADEARRRREAPACDATDAPKRN